MDNVVDNDAKIVIDVPKSKTKKQALSKQPAEMKKLQTQVDGKVTEMINKDELPVSKDIDWEDVSGIPIFNYHKFSPIERLIEQYHEVLETIQDEKDKENPSNRILTDLQNTLLKINQTLLPYRYSKVDLVKVESPHIPVVTVELTGLTVKKEEVIEIVQ